MYQDITIIKKLDQMFLGENLNKDTSINSQKLLFPYEKEYF